MAAENRRSDRPADPGMIFRSPPRDFCGSRLVFSGSGRSRRVRQAAFTVFGVASPQKRAVCLTRREYSAARSKRDKTERCDNLGAARCRQGGRGAPLAKNVRVHRICPHVAESARSIPDARRAVTSPPGLPGKRRWCVPSRSGTPGCGCRYSGRIEESSAWHWGRSRGARTPAVRSGARR